MDHVDDVIEDKAHRLGEYAIAYALLQISREPHLSAVALKELGVNDAMTPMGAIELLALEVKNGLSAIESAMLLGKAGEKKEAP